MEDATLSLSPIAQIESTQLPTFSMPICYLLSGYLFSAFLSFFYILLYGEKSMPFYRKFFSSLITPFIFLIILFKNTLHFIHKILITILEKFCEYIINPLIRIAIYRIFVPIAELIDYLYRHSTIVSSFLKLIYKLFSKIIDILWIRILFPILYFCYCRILIPIITFIINYIIFPFYQHIIVPIGIFINNNRAFHLLLSFIMKFYKSIYDYISDAITFVGKICKIIIDASEELMKETYDQIIVPFIQLVKRIFGD